MKRLAIIAAVLLIAGCRKDNLPEPVPADPVFLADLTVDGQPLSLQAGVENFSMAPSYYKDSTELLVFSGELRPASPACAGCGWSLQVLLNNHRKGDVVAYPDSSFYTGQRMFEGPSTGPEFYDCTFRSLRPVTASFELFEWTIDNGSSKETATGTELQKRLEAGKTYTVSLHFDDGLGNCDVVHRRVITPGRTEHINAVAQRSGSQNDLQYTFSCTPFVQGYKYSWDFGDGTASNLWKTDHKYSPNGNVFIAVLTVINTAGDTTLVTYQVPGSLNGGCEANFTTSMVPVPNPKRMSTVTVILTDPNGDKFTTAAVAQAPGSSFFVEEQSAYDRSTTGAATRKLKMSFYCQAKGNTRTVTLGQGKAVLAFAHP